MPGRKARPHVRAQRSGQCTAASLTARPRGPGPTQVRKAFEFALDRVGQALDSGPLWEAYVTFLKGIAPDTPEHKKVFATVPGQEVASQREALRRAYQRALRVPQHRLDMLWREYERFEQTASASPEMARKMIEDMSPVRGAGGRPNWDGAMFGNGLGGHCYRLSGGRLFARESLCVHATREGE